MVNWVPSCNICPTCLHGQPNLCERLPGTTPIRQKMVSDAVLYLDNLAAESSGDTSLRGELASAYDKIGDIQGNPFFANLGDMDGALASYNKSLAIREDLLAGKNYPLDLLVHAS